MKKTIILSSALAIVLAGCSHKSIPVADNPSGNSVAPTIVQPASFIPKATVFKMNGPYADRVAVTVVNGQLTYFPAPGDISADSQPIYVGDGWWLNRQGVSANSVFTDWTFKQYAELSSSPSPSEIMKHIIPGAEVTEMRQLSLPVGEAANNLKQVRTELGI